MNRQRLPMALLQWLDGLTDEEHSFLQEIEADARRDGYRERCAEQARVQLWAQRLAVAGVALWALTGLLATLRTLVAP